MWDKCQTTHEQSDRRPRNIVRATYFHVTTLVTLIYSAGLISQQQGIYSRQDSRLQRYVKSTLNILRTKSSSAGGWLDRYGRSVCSGMYPLSVIATLNIPCEIAWSLPNLYIVHALVFTVADLVCVLLTCLLSLILVTCDVCILSPAKSSAWSLYYHQFHR